MRYTQSMEPGGWTVSLKVGKKADMITLELETDPFLSGNKNSIKNIRMLQTILGGEEILRPNRF